MPSAASERKRTVLVESYSFWLTAALRSKEQLATGTTVGGGGMLDQALIALAALGGTAVVQAAGTDAWEGIRRAVAQWFGCGDTILEQAELERLDASAAALEAAGPGEAEREQARQEGLWHGYFQAMLERLDGPERERAAEALQTLLGEHTPVSGMMAIVGKVAAGRDVTNSADHGSIAATLIEGGASIGTPHQPDPSKG